MPANNGVTFKTLKERKYKPKILYPVKRNFLDKDWKHTIMGMQTLKEYFSHEPEFREYASDHQNDQKDINQRTCGKH